MYLHILILLSFYLFDLNTFCLLHSNLYLLSFIFMLLGLYHFNIYHLMLLLNFLIFHLLYHLLVDLLLLTLFIYSKCLHIHNEYNLVFNSNNFKLHHIFALF